jgi:adenylosuccinate synthase
LPVLLCSVFAKYTSTFSCIAAEQSELEKVEVEYITMPGWKTSIAHVKSMGELPPNARRYIEKLQELIGVKSEYCGCMVGKVRSLSNGGWEGEYLP